MAGYDAAAVRVREFRGSFRGAGGLRLAARCWRPGDREPRAAVALVHGFGEHSGRYTWLVEYLVGRGFVVYGYDHRGHGHSPGPRGHIRGWDEYRGDLHAFLAMVRDREPQLPLFLYAHSLGGLIGLEFLLRHPEVPIDGAVISSPPLGAIGVSPLLQAASRVASRLWPSLGMNTGLDPSTISRDPEALRALAADSLSHTRATARFGTEMAAAVAWSHANAHTLRLPILIVHGEADRLVDPEGSRAFFARLTAPDRERRTYPGGHHELHNDTGREALFADVGAWLERQLVVARARGGA